MRDISRCELENSGQDTSISWNFFPDENIRRYFACRESMINAVLELYRQAIINCR